MARRSRPPPRASRGRPAPPAGERLQKALARAGLGSRRAVEDWIAAGRVSVNGRPARLGERVGPHDRIRVDGRPVRVPAPRGGAPTVLRYHKPVGEVTSRRDEQGRRTVFEALPRRRARPWIAVGRLDVNTSGLLLFTDDGELAHRLMHPARALEREYAVRVRGTVGPGIVERLERGVELADGPARFERVRPAGGEGANRWFHVVLREGRHREVRRLWESQGLEVSRLIRVRFGPVGLPRSLRSGRYERLAGDELEALLEAAGHPVTPAPAPLRRRPRARRGRR